MKMMNRPNTVTHFQSIGFCQRRREPDFGFLYRIGPVVMAWTQRRQRGGERTAVPWVFLVCAGRGKTHFSVAGKEPVRAFGVIQMAAFHQHRTAAHRQQRAPALSFRVQFAHAARLTARRLQADLA
jgi:hypothetical protein